MANEANQQTNGSGAPNKNVIWTIVGIAVLLAILFLIFWAISRGWRLGQKLPS